MVRVVKVATIDMFYINNLTVIYLYDDRKSSPECGAQICFREP